MIFWLLWGGCFGVLTGSGGVISYGVVVITKAVFFVCVATFALVLRRVRAVAVFKAWGIVVM